MKTRCQQNRGKIPDPVHLVNDSISHNKLRDLARLYWTADNVSTQTSEILFEGDIFVEDECNSVV